MTHSEMDIRRKEFFNDHAENWLDMFYFNPETGKYDKHAEQFVRLFDCIMLRENDTVLDSGCGCGVLAPCILERIGPKGLVYEVDYSEKMIAVNKQLHDDPRIRFMTCSVDELDLPSGSVDSAICFACFPHFQDKDKTLNVINRSLRAGGILTIAHLNCSEEINNHHRKHECVKHDHLLPEPEMRALLKDNGFTVELFTDEPGFYCIRAVKQQALEK